MKERRAEVSTYTSRIASD